ncbi:MAG TPA: hypothetical protein VET48_03825, partial [Steroidobacteraceae bacterium]|nr:hypothetical protein [Steroidobacteraceae bacterium]
MLLVAGDQIARYGFKGGHQFGPDRHDAFMQELRASGIDAQIGHIAPRVATESELLSFHTQDYIDFVRERCAAGLGYLDGGDTPAQRGIFESACYVVGATLVAVDELMGKQAQRAFVPIAGLHHAARDAAAGFCVLNDIGVAIEQLRHRYNVQRIAYVDIDAHHGDGVYYSFADDPLLFLADLHEDGATLYPGTGAAHETGIGAAVGTKLNLPLPAGADDRLFEMAWSRALKHIETAEPDFIILQCGADSIAGDPITHLQFSPQAHARAAHDLCALADR